MHLKVDTHQQYYSTIVRAMCLAMGTLMIPLPFALVHVQTILASMLEKLYAMKSIIKGAFLSFLKCNYFSLILLQTSNHIAIKIILFLHAH